MGSESSRRYEMAIMKWREELILQERLRVGKQTLYAW